MRILFNVLVVAGGLLLLGAVAGRFMGHPNVVVGLKVMNVVLLANTVLLLAIIIKLSEKKLS